MAGLRAGHDAESGLAAAIGSAAREITDTKDVRLKLKLDRVPRKLPADVEYNLLRIASEAVSNSVKHSGARNIEVALESTPRSAAAQACMTTGPGSEKTARRCVRAITESSA